jgi:hypothetical protein
MQAGRLAGHNELSRVVIDSVRPDSLKNPSPQENIPKRQSVLKAGDCSQWKLGKVEIPVSHPKFPTRNLQLLSLPDRVALPSKKAAFELWLTFRQAHS